MCLCRFHVTVSASLATHKVCHSMYPSILSVTSHSPPSLPPSLQPEVVELRQQLSGAMTVIQMAVLDIMKSCVAELKTANPAVRLAMGGSVGVSLEVLFVCSWRWRR